MDDYRKIQKKYCLNGSPNLGKVGGTNAVYGCPCCRMGPWGSHNTNYFKKWTRRIAKVKLREEDRKNLNKE